MDLEVQFMPKLSQVQLSIFLNSAKLGDRQMPEEHIWKAQQQCPETITSLLQKEERKKKLKPS